MYNSAMMDGSTKKKMQDIFDKKESTLYTNSAIKKLK
jgi:hypothetical protein